jgi:hypothetical protein
MRFLYLDGGTWKTDMSAVDYLPAISSQLPGWDSINRKYELGELDNELLKLAEVEQRSTRSSPTAWFNRRHRIHQITRNISSLSASTLSDLLEQSDPFELPKESQRSGPSDAQARLDDPSRHDRVFADQIDELQRVDPSQP